MEASLKMLRTVRIAMLISIVLYVLVGERTAHPAKLANLVVYYAMTLMVVAMVATMFLVRRVMVIRAEQTLAQKPEDRVSLNRWRAGRSEEHTSELQSLAYLVCRLMLEKKKYC